MDLLEFARGPGLVVSVAVFVLGSAWRLAGVLRRPRMPDLSPPREGAPSNAAGAWHGIVRGMWPRREFGPAVRGAALNGWAFHVGLALIFFGYGPHIAFIRRYTGLSWPALPDAAMVLATAVTIVSLLIALVARMSDPVLRTISTIDDKITWTVTFLPVITGMALIAEPAAATVAHGGSIYRGPLAVHLLSLELLLVWFPFGKLMHAFLFAFSRGATGMRFSHRGVRT